MKLDDEKPWRVGTVERGVWCDGVVVDVCAFKQPWEYKIEFDEDHFGVRFVDDKRIAELVAKELCVYDPSQVISNPSHKRKSRSPWS